MVSLSPIPADFQENDEEFEDICVMYRIIDSVTEEVSEDKLIKLIKDAYVQLLRKLTRGRVGDVKEIEEDLNRIPVFGGTMTCWVMTMPFGAFYFVQRLGSVQIPMN
ncbi:7658_t:CDS:2 [Ambispora leptoticha]|uniref:7658_t:CDS:1 n=1 Tax=Ambispora leptoticha TaxID=144679 RepID=A0A9N8V2I6_9GLOM|nr:7658_t:CDS:2 [Ambispora leptoticha]